MSRPLKLKVSGTVLCSVFQLPDHGFIGQFAGAHRRRFFPKRVGWASIDLRTDTSETRPFRDVSRVSSNYGRERHPLPIRCYANGYEGLRMGVNYFLDFHQNEEARLLLPPKCGVSISCYDSKEVRDAIATSIEQSLYALALSGMDLRALDGVTVTSDARKAVCELQDLPPGAVPLEMTDQPGTMELARTVAVRRGDEFRFHIVLRAGLGLMTLSAKPEEQALVCGCLAHEAAHVEHEAHLYRTFPDVYGRTLDCGDHSRQSFIKALDVWSEYAACRSSAQFRAEAMEDFDRAFCVALQESRSSSQKWIENFRDGGNAAETFREIQQVFGDAFICAGYLLGHLHGLEKHGVQEAPGARQLLAKNPYIAELISRLERVLKELWLSEFGWDSLEVFAPIYDLLCEMMALHGMAFARRGDQWHIVISDEAAKTSALRDFLLAKVKEGSGHTP